MAGERLTDERIAALCVQLENIGLCRDSATELRAMANELRERRTADLTADERRVLRDLAGWVEEEIVDRRGEGTPNGWHNARYRALSVLDKLLSSGGGR